MKHCRNARGGNDGSAGADGEDGTDRDFGTAGGVEAINHGDRQHKNEEVKDGTGDGDGNVNWDRVDAFTREPRFPPFLDRIALKELAKADAEDVGGYEAHEDEGANTEGAVGVDTEEEEQDGDFRKANCC